MVRAPVTQIEATAMSSSVDRHDRRAARLVLGTLGLIALLAVCAAIGRLDGLAFALLLYLAGFAAALRLMLGTTG